MGCKQPQMTQSGSTAAVPLINSPDLQTPALRNLTLRSSHPSFTSKLARGEGGGNTHLQKPKGGCSQQNRQAEGGGKGGRKWTAVVHQAIGHHFLFEAIFLGHASEHAFLQRQVRWWRQHARGPWDGAGIALAKVVLFPAIGRVVGADRARKQDRTLGVNDHIFGHCGSALHGLRGKQRQYVSTEIEAKLNCLYTLTFGHSVLYYVRLCIIHPPLTSPQIEALDWSRLWLSALF